MNTSLMSYAPNGDEEQIYSVIIELSIQFTVKK